MSSPARHHTAQAAPTRARDLGQSASSLGAVAHRGGPAPCSQSPQQHHRAQHASGDLTMKRHVAATVLAITALGVIDVHVDVNAQDGRYMVLWQGKKHDVIGKLADRTNAIVRDCSAVKRLDNANPKAQQALALIAQYSPPDSEQVRLVGLLEQGPWLVAELTFARLNPAVVVLHLDSAGMSLPERAIWSGSTEPWKPGPLIRRHLRAQVPQAPQALLDCLDPMSFDEL